MKLSPIDMNLLMALDAILTTRSVTRAATAVGLSKPAMSHALARLRTQMDDPILVRAGQKWVLSERAEGLSPYVHSVVVDATKVLSPARTIDARNLRREFRILATDHVLSVVGLAFGHLVTDEAPHVRLRFLPPLDDQAAALRDNVDLAIGVFDELPGDLRRQMLFRDEQACVVRAKHTTVHGKISIEQFVGLKHVLVEPGGPTRLVEEALQRRGVARRCARVVPYALNALEFVAMSDCIVTLSARLARRYADRFQLQVLKPPLPLPRSSITQVWHPRVDADGSHVWLRRLMARVAASADGHAD